MKSDIKIYGTLVNHTANKTIAYADQILDKQFGDGMMLSEINRRVIGFVPTDTTGIESNIGELQSNIESINGNIEGVNGNISGLDGRISSVESLLNDAIERLANTRETVDQNLVKITHLNTVATDYGNRITYLEQHQGVDPQAFSNYYTKDEVEGLVDGVRNDIPNVNQALSNYFTKTEITNNYYTKSDITGLLEGLSPQQGNITRLNIYDEDDNSKYSYIKCSLDRYGEPRIFIPNLYVDDTVEADSINISNDGIVGTLKIMYLDCFDENNPDILVNANLIPDNGRETIGNEDHPWNAIYTGDLAVTGDAYFTGAFAVNAIKSYTGNSPLRLSGDVQVSGDILPNTEISNTLGSEDYRWNGWFEVLNVGDLYVNGEELPFDSYYTKNEIDSMIGGNSSSIPQNLSVASLETSGDVVVGGNLLIGDLIIRENENNQGHFEVYGQGEDICVLHYDVIFDNIYPSYVKTGEIDFYDSQLHQNKTARIEGVYDSVSDKTYLSVTGQLTVDNRNILNELDVLNTFVENHGSAIDNFFNSTDSLVDMLNSIHVVLLKENSDLGNNITVRCNKFVKDGGDLTVNVYDATGEPSNTYSKTIYNASLVDITDSLDITDGQDGTSFTIEGVEEDLIISIEYQSPGAPPYNPGL